MNRLPSLDGLRALSVAFVVAGHLSQTNGFPAISASASDMVVALGPLGVRVFFVISGFLITSLLIQERQGQGAINLSRFYLRRTLRIFVPYYAFIFAVVALSGTALVTLGEGDVLHALTYTVNYHSTRSWSLGHAWSLSTEEQFYLLWPAVLVFAGTRRGIIAATAVLLVCPLIRLWYAEAFPWLIGEEVGYRFETTADSLAAGCFLAGHYRSLLNSYKHVLETRWFVFVPIIVLVAALVDQRLPASLAVGVTVQNLGIAACIGWALNAPSGVVSAVLNSSLMSFVGRISYSVYLWQQLFLNPYSSSTLARFPYNLPLAILAALVSFYAIEKPSLALRERIAGVPRRAPLPAASA